MGLTNNAHCANDEALALIKDYALKLTGFCTSSQTEVILARMKELNDLRLECSRLCAAQSDYLKAKDKLEALNEAK